MPYGSSFDAFVAPARFRPALWRLVLGCVLVVVVWVVIMVLTWAPFDIIWPGALDDGTRSFAFLLLFSFVGLIAGLALAVRYLHQRVFLTLFGDPDVLWRDFGAAILVWVLVSVLSTLILWPVFELDPWIRHLDLLTWALAVLPLALVALGIQTLAEELAFRGYLQQQLAARFSQAWVWLLVPSVIFALGHYDAEGMGDNVMIILCYFVFWSVLLADLTARTGSIGVAWGLHFANNIWVVTVASYDDDLGGLALYHLPFTVSDPILITLVLVLIPCDLVIWWVLRIWRAR